MAGSSSHQEQNSETERYLNYLNHSLSTNYLYALVALVVIVFVYHSVLRLHRHARHLVSLGGNTRSQRYFSFATPTVAWFKDHFVYAPLLYHRRAQEIKCGPLVILGTVPTRFQALFIISIVVYNVFACVWNIPWSSSQLEVLPILRNRTGSLATVNLIPICVLATIKNPLINALDISYDSFNLVHRWLGRLSILEGVAHTLCWMVAKVQKGGWSAVQKSLTHSSFIYTGLIATVGFVALGLHSPKVFRSLAYEFFLHSHILLVAMTFGGLWIHLVDLPQQMFLLAAIIIWIGSRLWRLCTLLYRSCGRGGSYAAIEPLQRGAVRVSITCARPWKVRPGQTLYLSIPSIGWLTLHPFSVAWAESGMCTDLDSAHSMKSKYSEYSDKTGLVGSVRAVGEGGPEPPSRTLELIIKQKAGFTSTLLTRAQQGGGRLVLPAYVEGPYGHETSLASFGTLVLFATGVGITHHMLYVRSLVQGFTEGTVATQHITLVWVVPDRECLDWV
ncbi:FAD-binding domain-containing protein isoform 1 [Cladophialophora immunda]|nr:FAD-binding domain-containing protein isoform 1 [Cladophialophora immunda]